MTEAEADRRVDAQLFFLNLLGSLPGLLGILFSCWCLWHFDPARFWDIMTGGQP